MKTGVQVPRVKSRSIRDIEEVAQKFLRDFAPNCLKRPERTPVAQFFDRDLYRQFRFAANVENLPPGIEGLTDCGAKTVSLAEHVYEGLCSHDGRSRFTTCHEIGHVVLHAKALARRKTRFSDGSESGLVLKRRSELHAFEDPEWQADSFSAALLMPSPMVIELLRKVGRSQLIPTMVGVFAVSFAAAERRLKTIGRTSVKKRR